MVYVLSGENMDVYLVKTDDFTFSQLAGYLACLTKIRRERVLKKVSDTDKLNSLISGLLVSAELTRRTGIPQKKLHYERGAHGKPYLKGGGVWFSLSHTAGAVCAAFSENEEIGVDIERADRKVNQELYKRVLSAQEQERLHSQKDFLCAWVSKEAFLKRLGIGVSRDLRGVDSLSLPDTKVLEYEDFLVGVSGKEEINLIELPVKELLKRFPKAL